MNLDCYMKVYFEDQYYIAVEKPAKKFIHPMPGERESKDCLLFDVRDHLESKIYPVHRLDRAVSGIVIFAKTPKAATKAQEIWNKKTTHKKYLCLNRGKIEKSGVYDVTLSKSGVSQSDIKKEIKQEALTLYNPIEYFHHEFCTYTEVEIKTGRFHQIRRHFRKDIKPLIGDRKHGKGKVNNHFADNYGMNRIFLHCHELEFNHPYTGELILLNSPLPDVLNNVILKLRVNN
jgi:tRNA pseudouridine65 synthase